MKYFKFPGTIYKLTTLIVIMIILTIAIESNMPGWFRIFPEGRGLIFTISTIIAFNNSLRKLFNIQRPALKVIILISGFWIILSTAFLMIFLNYGNVNFFGRYALDGISILLFVPLFLFIGMQFYTIYVNSLKAKDE